MYEELILSSGGIYIVHYLGALQALQKYFPIEKFKYYTGCSAGAILSFAFIVGFSVEDLINLILELDITECQDLKIGNLLENYGFDNGDGFNQLFNRLLDEKGYSKNITFLELYEKTNKILTVSTTNLTKSLPEYHNFLSTPHLKVVDSVLMSMNIPILFQPMKRSFHYNNIYQENHYYIDGGALDPFPFKVMKKVPIEKKIGIFYYDQIKENNNEYMESIQNYIFHMLKMISKHFLKEKYKFLKDEKALQNIFIFSDNINAIDFGMSPEIKRLYIQNTHQKFESFYLKNKRIHYLSSKYFSIWYSKIKRNK